MQDFSAQTRSSLKVLGDLPVICGLCPEIASVDLSTTSLLVGGRAIQALISLWLPRGSGKVNHARDVAQHDEIEIIDIAEIPLFDSDLGAGGDPAAVVHSKRAIYEAEEVLIATPEYQ